MNISITFNCIAVNLSTVHLRQTPSFYHFSLQFTSAISSFSLESSSTLVETVWDWLGIWDILFSWLISFIPLHSPIFFFTIVFKLMLHFNWVSLKRVKKSLSCFVKSFRLSIMEALICNNTTKLFRNIFRKEGMFMVNFSIIV